MKIFKRIAVVIAIVMLLGIMYNQFNVITKEYSGNIDGIKIQIGNHTYKEEIKIKIEGEFKRKRMGNVSFSGTIIVNGEKLQCSEFDKNNMALLTYDDNGYSKTYGQLYINDKLDKFTVTESFWSNKDGIMLIAPAQSREDGLVVVENSMKKFLTKANTKLLD